MIFLLSKVFIRVGQGYAIHCFACAGISPITVISVMQSLFLINKKNRCKNRSDAIVGHLKTNTRSDFIVFPKQVLSRLFIFKHRHNDFFEKHVTVLRTVCLTGLTGM